MNTFKLLFLLGLAFLLIGCNGQKKAGSEDDSGIEESQESPEKDTGQEQTGESMGENNEESTTPVAED